eukprot:12923150-Prorocentrum_lima.AAC.1
MVDVDRALVKLRTELEVHKRGMEFVIEQVDQVEQNLQVDFSSRPTPLAPPVHQPPPQPGHELPGAR